MPVGTVVPAGRRACAVPRLGCPQGTPLRLFWRVVGRQWELRGRPAHGWVRARALRGCLVRQQQDGGDPAGGFGEVLDLVRLEGPAEDVALAVGEPLLEDLVAA